MSGLNESQRIIADTTEGMIVADAGPGTGKTHTVVSRCVNIIRKPDFGPKDLIMLTFTRNAATEMKDRVQAEITRMASDKEIGRGEYEKMSSIVKQMYIGTFDSFCLAVVKQSPYAVSKFFGFDEELNRGADIVQSETLNRAYFSRFLNRFLEERGQEFGDLAALAAKMPYDVYALVNRLMARGILPYRRSVTGKLPWFGGNNGKDLIGDTKALRAMMDGFKEVNADKAKKLKGHPTLNGVSPNLKDITPKMKDEAALDDRSALLDLIHEIYMEYLRRCVIDGHLTFNVVATFAFLVLYGDKQARETFGTRYLIVDEFQDTNSMQLMISLMILKEPNLCVVGDWKQGIYGFRFVSIENITRFEERVRELKEFLNDDAVRITFPIGEIKQLPLKENYRSSQLIIDRAYESLLIPGTSAEPMDLDGLRSRITPIVAKNEALDDHTDFECVKCGDKDSEIDEVLRRIVNYVSSDRYTIVSGDSARPPRFGDIAVLCRSVKDCRLVYQACLDHKIPAFLQGELEIMSTREGKLLLAWLKYISNDRDMWGIVPILADMGYSAEEIDRLRYYRDGNKDHPVLRRLREYKGQLRAKRRRVTELISGIFAFYGLENNITQAITSALSSAHRDSLATISNLIRIIEDDIDCGARYDVDGLPLKNAVTVQTLHKSKGLEYPIVIIPRVDSNSFPNTRGETGGFRFNDTIGIRCTKEIVHFGNEKEIAESWKTAVAVGSLVKDYSEERRLLFVGISRAKQYVTLIASKGSPFFTHYAESGVQDAGTGEVPVYALPEEDVVDRPVLEPIQGRRKNIPVHGIMHLDRNGYSAGEDSDEVNRKGMQYGTDVHKLADMLVRGGRVTETDFENYPQLRAAKGIIDGLRGNGAVLTSEIECSLPLNDLNATLRGVIDLIAEFPDRIEIHDWKTDSEPAFRSEYEIQLSVYAHVLAHVKDKPVECHIDWLTIGDTYVFGPVPMEEISKRAAEYLDMHRASRLYNDGDDDLLP